MATDNQPDPKVGDRITFRAATRWDDKTVTRKVNGFFCGWPTVRYGGCPNFIVKHHEIKAIECAA